MTKYRQPAERARVLVVDDEPANRKLLGDLVAREGYEAVITSGGAEALAILAREPIDLVLLDMMMPDVDGIAVLEELQKQGLLPALPVVMITAADDRKVRIDALAAGAIDFLTKPADHFELGCKLRALTELKQLRDQAREQGRLEAKATLFHSIQRAMEQLPLYIYEGHCGPTGEFEPRWVIGNAEELTGIALQGTSPEEWLGHIHPDESADVQNVVAAVNAGKFESWNVQYRWRHGQTGEENWHLNVGRADPLTRSWVGATLDISHLKRLEEQLAQSQKMEAIGRLAGGIAHDFNNLLAVILSFGKFARDGLAEDEQRWDDITEVLNAAQRAAALTQQLLTFSRQQPAVKVAVDLRESLTQLHKILATAVGEDVELIVATGDEPVIVCINPVQFDQIVLNLAVNARDAMPQGGRLRITLEATMDNQARMTVTDTGMGMDEATRRRLFEPFFTTKGKGKGTGLGLPTCYAITKQFGGRIQALSTPGEGATFIVSLPLCLESVNSPALARPEAPPSPGEVVLVAEDEPALRRATVRTLEAAGYQVHAAADGNEAIALIDALGATLDLILTDVVMPGCSGYDVADHASRVVPDVAVIVTSGYLNEAEREGFPVNLPLLWKPVAPQDLVRTVQDALQSRDKAHV